MKEKIRNLIATYKRLLPKYRGDAKYILENVIEDLETLLKDL